MTRRRADLVGRGRGRRPGEYRRPYAVPHSGGWPRSCPSCGRETVFSRRGCSDCCGVPPPTVTPRMLEALALLGAGASRVDVARRMGISAGRLDGLLGAAYSRLGVSTLVGAFVALGWLVPDRNLEEGAGRPNRPALAGS